MAQQFNLATLQTALGFILCGALLRSLVPVYRQRRSPQITTGVVQFYVTNTAAAIA